MQAKVYTASFQILSSTKPMGQWPNLLTLRGKGGEVFEAFIGHSGQFDARETPPGVKWGSCFPNDWTGLFPELKKSFILGEEASKTASSLHIEWNEQLIRFTIKDWGIKPLWFDDDPKEEEGCQPVEPGKSPRYREFLLLYRAVKRAYPHYSVVQALRATEYRLHIRWGARCEQEMGSVYYWLWKEKAQSLGNWKEFGELLNDQLEEDGGTESVYFFELEYR